MKKKALNKMLAVAAFGLVTANVSIDAKAAESDNIVGTTNTTETAEKTNAESPENSSTQTMQSDESTKSNTTETTNTTKTTEKTNAESSESNSAQTTQSDEPAESNTTETPKSNSPETVDVIGNEPSTDNNSASTYTTEKSIIGTTNPENNNTAITEIENPDSTDTLENSKTGTTENNTSESTDAADSDTTQTENSDSADTSENGDTDTTENSASESADVTDSNTTQSEHSNSTDTFQNDGTDITGSKDSDSTDTFQNSDTDITGNETSTDTTDLDTTEGNTPETTDTSPEYRKPTNFEEAKDNLEKAQQEESAAKDKVDHAQNEADQAQADFDHAKQEAETANNELKKLEVEKNKAQTDKAAADQVVADSSEAVEKSESNFNDKLSENGIDHDTFAEMQEALDDKKTEVTQAQQKADQAQEEYNAKEQEVSEAQKKADEAQKTVDEAQKEKNKADEKVLDASANVTTAQNALEEAKNQTVENAVDAAKSDMDTAEKALNQMKEQINKGSLGFFEEMAATETNADSTAGQAVKVLTSTEDMRDNKGDDIPSWDEFRSYTKIGDATDATSLDNMKKTFDLLRECNNLRTNDDLRPGCESLYVTDFLMAVAQMNANWTRESNGNYNNHANVFNIGDNLALAPSGWDPFFLWYTNEKENYKENPEWSNDTGHYITITNSLYTTTGFGICLPDNTSQHQWLSYSQSFSNYSTGKSYTIDEYEERFNNYYNKVKEQLAAAQKAYDEAKISYDKTLSDVSSIDQLIKDNIAAKQKELDAANEALSSAQKQASEKNTILENAKSAKVEADNQFFSVQTELGERYERLTEAKAKLKLAQQTYNEAYSSAETIFGNDIMNAYTQFVDAGDTYAAAVAAQEEADIQLEKAQTALASATAHKDAADKNVQDKESVLASKNAALNTAKKEYSLAAANLTIAQDDYNNLKPAASSFAYGSNSDNPVTNNDFITVSTSANGFGQTVNFSKDCSFKFFMDKLGSILKDNSTNEITIDCSKTHWYSINKKLLDVIKEKSNKEIVMIFSYQGQKYTFTIPANYDFSPLKDSNGWYGFMYLNMVFNGHEIVS